MLDGFPYLAAFALVRFHCSNLVEVSIGREVVCSIERF
jgi:hypothetical protein